METKIAAVHTEAREKLEERIAEAKKELEVKKEDFISKAETVKASDKAINPNLIESVNRKVKYLKDNTKRKIHL